MMKKLLVFAVAPLMLIALAGCEGAGKADNCCGTCQQAQAEKCCGTCTAAEAGTCCGTCAGSYCPVAKALKGHKGTVHCAKCDADVPAGKWCGKCNRFMLKGTVHCGSCDKDVPKGAYCAKCNGYAGVQGMTYCATCNSPYVKAKGCPGCKG